MHFSDGASPPPEIIAQWVELVHSVFDAKHAEKQPCIAVHCVAGLGRYQLYKISMF